MIGGAGSVAGPLVGAVVVGVLPELLSSLEEYRLLFFGALLLVVLWVAPDGVVGLLRGAARGRWRPATPRRRQRGARRRCGLAARRAAPALDGARRWRCSSAACAPSTSVGFDGAGRAQSPA